jgi:hypothetical protein
LGPGCGGLGGVADGAVEQDELGADIPVLDYMWHLRCTAEFDADDAYDTRAGAWRRAYAEMRVENFLCAGLENIDRVRAAASLTAYACSLWLRRTERDPSVADGTGPSGAAA